MPEIPTFNPRSLYPILGTAMPRTEIDGATRLPDLVVPASDDGHAGQAYVERRLLVDLLESPPQWAAGVVQHLALEASEDGAPPSPFAAFFITFNPGARLRICVRQTFEWRRTGDALAVAAIDDPHADVLAIDLGLDLAAHAWQTCAAVAGEHAIRLCAEVGFDLSPSGRKQYWPGRELAPLADYLSHRFFIKLAYVRHVLATRLRKPAARA